MLTLGTLVGDAGLKLAFADGVEAAPYEAVRVVGLTTLALPQLLDGEPWRRLEPGSLVLVTEMPFRLRGRATVALDTLMEQMALDACAALVLNPVAGAHRSLPAWIRDLSDTHEMPVLVSTAPLGQWAGTRHRLQRRRLAVAERRVSELDTLLRQLPDRLADPKAMQRITDWLADALRAQVLVSGPEHVLAASPTTAATTLPQVISRAPAAGPGRPAGPHTRLIPLTPASGADTVLGVARRSPFDAADDGLLKHTAKVLGLLDQARREHHAAAARLERAAPPGS
ncbi:hypothetical protein RB200_39485 [Streptomyces sp. PmtG]